ncbi:hypothetical protein [Haliangium ochraceum]|uniref:Uncharacterized protein n=1 Tax=Haliangium ochraceum (strain DSM 14365 / JCM 11303 / SMP-2) TaxID=502025 RepID=D0LWP8_HALO1|nr:hypothetical protein [Haliangium ochraceum]ACY17698.1 conserved hypothetical protein [Haliangium ochraceum DSM 14365]
MNPYQTSLRMLERLRSKNLHTWLGGYARHLARQPVQRISQLANGTRPAKGPRHLLFAMTDHYEPKWGKAAVDVGEARVAAWSQGYPAVADDFRDADGKRPQHSFFFPGEEYEPQYLEALADLVRGGYGEVEYHLHHDGDTAETLREQILGHLELLGKHGHLSRDPDGTKRYAFIHGNWSLANGREDGRWCGVDDELPVLWETGCYADMTFPSAPDQCQPNIVNQIYWPTGDLKARRSYEHGERAQVGVRRHDRLLLMQGPLALAKRPDAMSVRIESSAIDYTDPPSAARVRTWVGQNIHVQGRPEWVFVKIHTHGAPERNAAVLLGEDGRELHRCLTEEYNDGERWILHYVSAREMYNIAIAAMDGHHGDPNDYRDYDMPPPPVRG